MQYSFELNDDPQDESQANSIASDRLRKAIERNRAKQAAREAREAAPNRNPGQNLNARMGQPSQSARESIREPRREASDSMRASAGRWRETIELGRAQENRQESMQEQAPETPNWTPPRSRSSTQGYQAQYNGQQKPGPSQGQAGASRRSVGKVDDLEFTTNFRSPSKNLPVPVTYQTKPELKAPSTTTGTTAKPRKRATKASTKAKAEPEKVTWPIKLAWAFYGVLILRLIFSEGGVIDFYSQNSFYQGKESVLAEIKTENHDIYQEIQRIQTDEIYQKKLVRDHLGFIADDEFLVMFSNREVAASN